MPNRIYITEPPFSCCFYCSCCDKCYRCLSLSLVAFSFSGFTHQFNWKASAGLTLLFAFWLFATFFPYLLRRRLLLGFLINFPFCSMIFLSFCRARRCGLTFTLLRLSIVLDGASTVHRASWSLLKCIHIIKITWIMLISLMKCKVKEKRRSSRVHSFICCPHHLITFCTWPKGFVLFIDCPFFWGGLAKVDKGQQLINRDCVSKNQKSWNILSSSSSSNAVTIWPWVG